MIANIEMWAVERLIPYDRNVKKHPAEQVDSIVASIKATGWDQPIVVDAEGSIIKGHGRRMAAIKLGLKEVPVWVRRDLTPEQVKAARLNDNRAAMSGFDTEMMRDELASINKDLLDGVFDQKELDFMMADLGSMNSAPLIEDVDTAVAEHEVEAKGKTDAMATRRIPLSKAFGFSDVAGSEEILLTRFMARAESLTGLTGAEALVAFIKTLV